MIAVWMILGSLVGSVVMAACASAGRATAAEREWDLRLALIEVRKVADRNGETNASAAAEAAIRNLP